MTIGDLKKKIQDLDDNAPVCIGIADKNGSTNYSHDITDADLASGTFYISVNTLFELT